MNPNLKKQSLASLLIVCVLFAGGLAALSVLPHSHGADLDHSQHKSCPVYQFGLGHADSLSTTVTFVFLLFMALRFILPETRPSFQRFFSFQLLRAPPTAS